MSAYLDLWRETGMVHRLERTDFQRRRQALGISATDMASGTGLPPHRVAEIEDRRASDAHKDLYAVWLDIIERWPPDEKARQFRRAGEGNLFSKDR